MSSKSLECLAHLVGVVTVPALRQVFEARERREQRLLSWFVCGHLRLTLLTKVCRFHRSARPRGRILHGAVRPFAALRGTNRTLSSPPHRSSPSRGRRAPGFPGGGS